MENLSLIYTKVNIHSFKNQEHRISLNYSKGNVGANSELLYIFELERNDAASIQNLLKARIFTLYKENSGIVDFLKIHFYFEYKRRFFRKNYLKFKIELTGELQKPIADDLHGYFLFLQK